MRYSRLLKFCYIFLSLLLLSCGDANSKSENPTAKSPISGAESTTEETKLKPSILFFGNSLTAGLGVTPEESFPGRIAHRLDSLGYGYRVINAGLSGETTASGVNRIKWVLRDIPDIFILELGANDGLRGISLDETINNLDQIIVTVKETNPEVTIILTGMQMPPNMGPEYTQGFKQIFPDIARKHQVLLVPFLLEGVGGIPELNQADGIHQTAKGHLILAQNVWHILEPYLSL
ncbi:MAG: hypothetical protein RLZZ241_823 [Bacteroidota bacterium]